MENDVADAIETAASTNNEGKEEDSIPVKLVDEEERFQDQKSTSDHVVKAIDTAAPTHNEQNKDLSVAVELDDTG